MYPKPLSPCTIDLMKHIIEFEKIVPEGRALGRLDGKATFAVGPLPGETAEVSITKQKKSYNEAVLNKITEPSAHRHPASEDHAIACSPWQGVDYDYQIKLKRDMLSEAYRQHHLEIVVEDFVKADHITGYRNRLDFALTRHNGELELGFHARGNWQTLLALDDGCVLGSQAMNHAALQLVKNLNNAKTPFDNATITVRQSQSNQKILLILSTDLKRYDWGSLPPIDGADLVIAKPTSGGGPGKLLFAPGSSQLTEIIDGIKIDYAFDSFFQTNTPMFIKALEKIKLAAMDTKQLVELYSGVGAIGLVLAKTAERVTAIEIVVSAVAAANHNAITNKIKNYQAHLTPAEQMDFSLLDGADTVVLDPPRAGLHPRVIRRLLHYRPQRIIYLSCNPITQGRDIALLTAAYSPGPATGFDFYPQTLHLEALVTLSLR